MNGQNRSSPPRDIRDVVSFKMAAITTLNDRIGQQVFADRFGISLREWRTFATICYMENPSTTALAQESFLDKAQISRIVAQLVGYGLVKRIGTNAITGNRGGILQLTEKGRALYDEGLRFAQYHNNLLLDPLSNVEMAQLHALLNRLMIEVNRRYREVNGAVASIFPPQPSSRTRTKTPAARTFSPRRGVPATPKSPKASRRGST